MVHHSLEGAMALGWKTSQPGLWVRKVRSVALDEYIGFGRDARFAHMVSSSPKCRGLLPHRNAVIVGIPTFAQVYDDYSAACRCPTA